MQVYVFVDSVACLVKSTVNDMGNREHLDSIVWNQTLPQSFKILVLAHPFLIKDVFFSVTHPLQVLLDSEQIEFNFRQK